MAGKSLIGALRVTLGLDSAEFTEGVDRARQSVDDAKKDIVEFGNRMSGIGKALTVGVTLPLLAAGAAAVKGAQEQAAAMAQVETAIKSMGNTAGRTAEELAKQADALEMNSLFEGDIILKQVTANLLTFGNVAGEVFDRAQQAAVDMATRLGSEPQAAAIMLGKALNDPIKGVTALTKAGVQLSAAQKEQIKAFVKTGEVAKAQAIILDELEKQFGGAAKAAADTTPWRQAQVAINQTAEQFGAILLPMLPAISDAIIRVAQAIADLSPGMQQLVVVGGLIAAAFGPILVAAGSLTVALVTRLIPALGLLQVAFWKTAAVMTSATAATAALAAALRLLLIATGVGGAIALLAGAIYAYTTRTKEAVPASKAYSQSLETARQTAKDAQVASQNLAQAMGKEREAALKAAQAQRVLAEERLRAAQKKLLAAEYEARTSAAEAKKAAALADGGGPGEGVRGRISSGQQKFNDARKRAGQADADAKAAEEAVITLYRARAELDRQIANAANPPKLAPISVAAVDEGTKAVGRASKAVGGLSKEAQTAKEKAEALQAVLDRLFPEDAARREYEAQLKLIQESKLTEEQRAAAIQALRREYLGLHRDMLAAAPGEEFYPGIESQSRSIEDLNKDIVASSEEVLGRVTKKAEDTRVRVVESFAQMVDGAMRELDRFARGIQSGNILDIVGGLLNALDKFGSIFTDGKGFDLGPFKFGDTGGNSSSLPRFATGGSMKIGGLAGVDRNLLSMNGRPIAKVSRDETMTITPANGHGPGGRVAYFDLRGAVVTEDLLRQMNEISQSNIAAASPAIASMGANQAIAQSRRMQQRALS